jgi:hypothetical protein
MTEPDARGANFFWWVCTKNPFYAISAGLVLLGLWVSFGQQEHESETWLLMGGLAAYTLLLAGTAFLLVRRLKVWDDARTVLLLVVLMFLATSVTFDHVLVVDPARGATCYLLGLALSIVVSEGLLRGIGLRLPALYRMPYYFILTLFFLYPLGVRLALDRSAPMREPMLWALFGFSTAAALVFLTLMPALRRCEEYIRDRGSPPSWPWPLYPWSLFFILAIAVPGRAVLMCWSLHPLGIRNYDRLIFGPWFLVPFGFALTVLMLEMGRVLAKRDMVRLALGLPILLVGLSLLGHSPSDPVYRLLRVLTTPLGEFRAFGKVRSEPDPVYAEFMRIFTGRLGGDPVFYTLILAICFYGYAALRRVPLALEGLSVAVAALALIPTNMLAAGLLSPLEPGPLVFAGLLQLALGTSRRNAGNLLLGAGCLAGALAVFVPLESAVPGMRLAIFSHLTVLAMLVLGAMFRDTDGAVIRRLGACCVLLFALVVMHEGARVPRWLLPAGQMTYPLIAGILLAVYGQVLRDSYTLVIATLILGYWVFKFGWTAYRAVRTSFKGLDYIVSGLGFFMVALLVSLGKAGVITRWIESRWGPQPWLRRAPAREPRVLPVKIVEPAQPPAPEKEGGKAYPYGDAPNL